MGRIWGGDIAIPERVSGIPFESKLLPAVLLFLRINLVSPNYRYRYRLEIRMNFHYRYRLGARSHPFIAIDSGSPSRKSFELIFPKLPLPLPS